MVEVVLVGESGSHPANLAIIHQKALALRLQFNGGNGHMNMLYRDLNQGLLNTIHCPVSARIVTVIICATVKEIVPSGS